MYCMIGCVLGMDVDVIECKVQVDCVVEVVVKGI